MKVAFFTYPSAFQNVGGGEILLLKTKEYLEKEGVQVDLFDMWRARIEDYDLLHVFGSVKDCLGLVQVAKARKVKVAISPIFWSDFRRAFFTSGPWLTKTDFFARHLLKIVRPSFPSARRRLLMEADVIFPNSEMEKGHIARLFAVPASRMRVVYNGVDKEFVNADPSIFQRRYGGEPFILSVGRIEPRKNQLNLIRAVRATGNKKLVLIGSPVSGYERYFRECQLEGEGFTTFLPTQPHGDPLIKSAYAACDLFVLQGWFETPGLAALEAALAGARLIVTQGGSTREYFTDTVDYIDPANPGDIHRKILKNLNNQKNSAVKERVLSSFTWDKAAKDTLRCYEEALRS